MIIIQVLHIELMLLQQFIQLCTSNYYTYKICVVVISRVVTTIGFSLSVQNVYNMKQVMFKMKFFLYLKIFLHYK